MLFVVLELLAQCLLISVAISNRKGVYFTYMGSKNPWADWTHFWW